MTDTNDLKEILDAMEEINLINDIRKKKGLKKIQEIIKKKYLNMII